MYGRIAAESAARAFQVRCSLEREQLCGIPFLLGRAYFLPGDSDSRRRRILRRLSRRLADSGVRRVVLPPGFPYEGELAAAGLSPFPVLGLYRAIAPQLALAGLRETGTARETATVALAAIRMNRSLWQAAFALCKQVRYLAVEVEDDGGAALRRRLRDHSGLPSLTGGTYRADFTLYYQRDADALCDGPGFLLCPDADRQAPAPFLFRSAVLRPEPGTVSLPQGCAAEPLLAALYELGRIRAEEITVVHLANTPEPPFLPASE